jgi:hypothetical protein
VRLASLGKIPLFGSEAVVLHSAHLDIDLAPSSIGPVVGWRVTYQIEVAQVAGNGLEDLSKIVRLLDAIESSSSLLA